ncbi:MAG TPA: Gldg family protein [Candidatus Binataceae bacterium]|nr:Gldg family protein [Candidatus Binataceae bacterium]
MDRPQVTNASGSGRVSLWKNYLILVYTAVALAALLGVINAIISIHNVKWDLTPEKRFSLSDFDKRVLGGLTHPVKVMAFVRTEDPAYLELADLLFQAAAFTPRLTYQVIDVNKAPGMAREYGINSYGEVVVESEGRRRDFDNARSELLIPAILQISQDQTKHIYFTVGHGERDLFDTDRNTGYSQWRNLLQQNNYEIDNVSLFASGVPDDCKVLISLGPKKDFLPEEIAALQKYLAKGGHFIVMIDPFGSPSLVDTMKKYYLNFSSQVLVDPAYRLSAGEILTTQVPLRSTDNAISRAMTAPAVFSLARGVFITGKVGDAAPDNLQLAMETPFLESSHESWASGDDKALTTGITNYQDGRDLKGPIPIGSEVDFTPAANPHVPLMNMTRIVGFGSSAFVSNQFIEMLSNQELAVGVVNELAGDEMLMASRERLAKTDTAGFYITDAQSHTLLILASVVEPLLLFFIGTAVFARRRFFA